MEKNLTDSQLLELGEEVELTVEYKNVKRLMEMAGFSHLKVISKNFPVPKELLGKKVTVKVKLNHYGRDIMTDDVIAEIRKGDFREGNIFEQLALASAFPDLQRNYPIVALGSTWHAAHGHQLNPILMVVFDQCVLGLAPYGLRWLSYARFLVVRK